MGERVFSFLPASLARLAHLWCLACLMNEGREGSDCALAVMLGTVVPGECSANGGLATRVVLRTVPAQPVWCLGGLWSPCERSYRASSLLGQRCPSGRRDSVGCLTGFAPFDFHISYLYPGRFAPALPVSSTLRYRMSVIPG